MSFQYLPIPMFYFDKEVKVFEEIPYLVRGGKSVLNIKLGKKYKIFPENIA
jgi:hypothetical protein